MVPNEKLKLVQRTLAVQTDKSDMNRKEKKKHYERMTITPLPIEMSMPILAGSVTEKAIEVNSVEVEEFGNDTAFPADGFKVDFD